MSIDAIAMAAIASSQTSLAGSKAVDTTRSSTASATALVATAMNAVTPVGAPSYTSGVHMWNGAAEALNASPATIIPIPSRISASSLRSVMPFAISSKRNEPVPPYTSALPNSRKADPTEPTIRYLRPLSSEAASRRSSAHRM